MKESTWCLLLSKAVCKEPRVFLEIFVSLESWLILSWKRFQYQQSYSEDPRIEKMQGKRDIATTKDVLCKSHEGKRSNMAIGGMGVGGGGRQTSKSLNIYCSNSYVYILVKNSISVGLFVFVYEWTRLFSWEFTHRLQGHILRFIQFLTWRSLGAL